ncbi:MAG: dihydroxyacetone kinase subunit DhaK [Clostridia bacterium]|nr:dihydroxyacetone kinase subunit DhaK [Clostridia bacterium]
MNKIINDPDYMIQDMLQGYLYLHEDKYKCVEGTVGGLIKKNQEEKVSVIVGGGAGNEPWVLGYVGEGVADGLVSGNVYVAPPAKSILDVSKAVYNKKGILYVGTNHMGDVLNFELVGELAILDNIQTRCVFVNDDIASDLNNKENRRGVAGIALAVKMAGAASEMGLSLEEVQGITQKTIDNLRTLSVTTSPGYMPKNGKAMFEMEEGMIEYGMGFNGEPGILKEPLKTAKDIVGTMMGMLLEDLEYKESEEIAILLNGFGFTSILELHIAMKEIKEFVQKNNIKVYHADLQNLFCPQGTGGFSISLLRLGDDLIPYYNKKVDTPLFKRKELK